MDEDAELSRQIVELVTRRKVIRQSSQSAAKGVSPAGRALSKIIEDVQLVPSRKERDEGASNQANVWSVVENRKPRNKKKKSTNNDEYPLEIGNKSNKTIPRTNVKTNTNLKPKSKFKPKDNTRGDGQKRRPPRTAAVTIRGIEEKFSYADALRKLRREIALPDLDITASHVRKLIGGRVIIEISGADKTQKAEALKKKIAEVLGDSAKVTRPVVKGEVRLIGLDDSIVPEEVADVVAEAGGCKSDEVKVGMIRSMSSELFTVWAQCPFAAAIKAAKPGKIKIEWTITKIDLLKARQAQCFRCWRKGHLKAQCQSEIDRSDICYRCGIGGHQATSCVNPINCALCQSKGKDASHRVGSASCKASQKEDTISGENRVEHSPMDVEDIPARRAEETDTENA